jgi:hypothetical protein
MVIRNREKQGVKSYDFSNRVGAKIEEWRAICTRDNKEACVATQQEWKLATRWDVVMCELWVEETPGWHSVWSGRLFVPVRIGWRA